MVSMNEIFNKLIKADLTPNSFYYLYSISQNVAPNKYVNAAIESKKLQNDEWLDINNNLTPKAITFVQGIDAYFKTSKKTTSVSKMGENYMEKIEEYLKIFPTFKLPSGKYARSDKKNLENNFRWFFDNHNYSWETVLESTRRYVDEYEANGFKYMRTSQYFIRKQNTAEKSFESELANYCDLLNNGTETYNDFKFKEKVV